MNGVADSIEPKATGTWPLTASVIASEAPRYGTCCIEMPACTFSSSAAMRDTGATVE